MNEKIVTDTSETRLFPSLNTTANGDVALLTLTGKIEQHILQALHQGEKLTLHCATGCDKNDYGCLNWLVVFIDTRGEFKNYPAEMYHIYFLLNSAVLKFDASLQHWLKCLRTQDRLFLQIRYSSNHSRCMALMDSHMLKRYIASLDYSIAQWQPTSNIQLAVEVCFERRQLQPVIKECLNQINKCRFQSFDELLLDRLANTCIQQLAPSHPLRLLAQQDRFNSFRKALPNPSNFPPGHPTVNRLLSEIVPDVAENLIRTWLFIHHCLYPEGQKQPMIAMGLKDDGKWCWKPIPRLGGLEALCHYAESYRALLGQQEWQHLIDANDIHFPAIDSSMLCGLAKVPNFKHQETSKILNLAALQRQYGMTGRSTVIISKRGFESVSFYPLDRESRQCLFKIKLQTDALGCDLCLFGKLDAAAGAIEFVGQRVTDANRKPVELLLFLTAIAYRDLVVARDKLGDQMSNGIQLAKKQPRTSKNTPRQVDTHPKQGSTIIARMNAKRKLSKDFADHELLVEKIKQISPHIRVAHLRHLPQGHKVSQQQLQLGEEYGLKVPDGFTVVSPTIVGNRDDLDVQKLERRFRSISLLRLLF